MSEDKLKETKELIDLGLEMLSVGAKVSADGKVSLEDLTHVLALLPKLGPAAEGFEKVKGELASIDSESGKALVAYVVSKLSVGDEKAKLVVEKSLMAAVAVLDLIKAIKS